MPSPALVTKIVQSLERTVALLEIIYDMLENEKVQSNKTSGFKGSLNENSIIKSLKDINDGIIKLKEDNKKILKNQETILALSKKKETDRRLEPFEKAGDKNKQNLIKTGVSMILLIASGVLAIGMAFKLVGNINILSVLTLSLAIVTIAMTFERIIKLKLNISDVLIASLSIIAMSTSIVASSWILSMIAPVSMSQLLTAIVISLTFSFTTEYIAKAFNNIIKSIIGSALNVKDILSLGFFFITYSSVITASSWLLSLVRPISLTQGMTVVFISFTFAVISKYIADIINAASLSRVLLGNVNTAFLVGFYAAYSSVIVFSSWILSLIRPISISQALTMVFISLAFATVTYFIKDIILAAAMSKYLLKQNDLIYLIAFYTTYSAAIAGSSWILSAVRPISFSQALTALFISLTFAAISYFILDISIGMYILQKFVNINKIWILPIFYLAISTAITLSSHVLANAVVVPLPLLFNILVMSAVLSVSSVLVALSMFIINKTLKSPSALFTGMLTLIGISTTIMLVSLIFSVGDFSKYPSLIWTLSTTVSIVVFLGAYLALGYLVMFSQGAIVPYILMGSLALLTIASTITAVSLILSRGDYSYGSNLLPWALSVSMLYLSFTPVLLLTPLLMGSLIIGGILGVNPLIKMAKTIVDISNELSEGNYSYSDNMIKWTKSVVILYGSFTPLFFMTSLIYRLFGSGVYDVFRKSMTEIAKTIKEVSNELSGGVYKDGPTDTWSSGVSKAIAAFSSVYFKLKEGEGILGIIKGKTSPEDFKKAISIITQGIVEAGREFANAGLTVWSSAPTEQWSRGVSAAISGFAPVFKILSEKTLFDSIFGSGLTADDMKNSIKIIAEGIIEAADIFNKNKTAFSGNYPSKSWGEGVGESIRGFANVYELLYDNGWDEDDLLEWRPSLMHIVSDVINVADAFQTAKNSGLSWYSVPINYIKNTSSALTSWIEIYDKMDSNVVKYIRKDIITDITKEMVDVSKIISENSIYFNANINPNFMKNISSNVKEYILLAKSIQDFSYDKKSSNIFKTLYSNLTGSEKEKSPIDIIVSGMIKLGWGYNVLSKSMVNFGKAINNIDVEKLSSIRSLTSNIILMSLMDPSTFEEMMKKLEERAGVFKNLIEDLKSSSQGSTTSLSVNTSGSKGENEYENIYNLLMRLLSIVNNRLTIIARNSNTLAEYIEEVRTKEGVKIKR